MSLMFERIQSLPSSSQPSKIPSAKVAHKMLYVLLISVLTFAVIAAAIFAPQALSPQSSVTPTPPATSISGSPMDLRLNYAIGEHMLYNYTSTATTQQSNIDNSVCKPQTDTYLKSVDV